MVRHERKGAEVCFGVIGSSYESGFSQAFTLIHFYYCKPFFFRAPIFRDFRDLNSIREKYTIAKISMLIIFTVLGPYSCISGVFRVFAVFRRHCFSPIREKYTLAKI